MNNDEFYTYEDRAYIKPTLSSGEQEKFIDNFRDIQKQNTAQIADQTYNLGTQIPSNLGGLGGGESYFTSRYQTPQTNEMVQTLKAASQAQQLQDTMANYNAQLQNRYKQAYRKYQSRERARAKSSGSNLSNFLNSLLRSQGGTTNGNVNDKGVVKLNGKVGKTKVTGGLPGTTTSTDGNYVYTYEDSTGYLINTDNPAYTMDKDGVFRTNQQRVDAIMEKIDNMYSRKSPNHNSSW